MAEQLAARWGVVFRDLVARENLAVPWREILWAFRRMEARGTIRGGRFVAGFSGEQFAHPDAVDVLRAVRKQPPTGETVQISAADPLNLAGIVLPGPRIPAIPANTVTYVDGAVAAATPRPPPGTPPAPRPRRSSGNATPRRPGRRGPGRGRARRGTAARTGCRSTWNVLSSMASMEKFPRLPMRLTTPSSPNSSRAAAKVSVRDELLAQDLGGSTE